MVGRCAVPGCKSTYYKGNQKENEVTLFAIPKTSLSKWQELIPCSNLTSTSRICSRHFDESDFKTGVEILNVFHPYKRRTLNAVAIPKQFLLNDTSSRQAMQNVDAFKWRNNLNVEANASNASVRKRPKVDKIPTTTKRKKLDSTAPSMEVNSTTEESINIPRLLKKELLIHFLIQSKKIMLLSLKIRQQLHLLWKLPLLLFKKQSTFTRLLKKPFLIHFLV
uniref:THAP-type domain-containing protein n=1 Tax=Daphnia magna TaxID=35525 RepID=A0A0P6EP45_9CRUS